MAISQIVQNSLSDTISLGPKITSVQVANSTYVVKDDTAVNVGGGYIVITGSGFQSNCSVIVDSNIACSVAFVSSTQVRAELPAKPAGTYNLYLLNGDGGTAIRVNALQYSNTPTWVTASPLDSQFEDSNVSIQLSATGANTYVLQTGSTLPDGLTLSANGLISGFVNTNVAIDTTYNFTVEAIDTELQETPKAFAVTITVADPFFNQTVLLLDGDGTSGANNNVFRDSSNNNFAITRNGNTTQGTFSPFSPAGWSNYVDGSSGVYVSSNSNFNFGTGLFTIEGWFNFSSLSAPNSIQVLFNNGSSGSTEVALYYNPGSTRFEIDIDEAVRGTWTYTPTVGTWYHIALVKSSSTAYDLYVNGTTLGQRTHTYTQSQAAFNVGSITWAGDYGFRGNISNFRVLKGTALYTSNTSIANTELTAIANTVLLTAQSNRFKDNSNNNFSLSLYGTPKITPFSPFAPTAAYSAATHGGSAYFDGAGDSLTAPNNAAFDMTGTSYCFETWLYATSSKELSIFNRFDGSGGPGLSIQRLTNGTIIFYTGTQLSGSVVVPEQSWAHIACTFDGTTKRLFINGVLDASTTSGTMWQNSSSNLDMAIGRRPSDIRDFDLIGYLSGTRIVKGSAVYTTNFTPPTTPVTNISGTSLLLNYTNAGILDYTTKNVVETLGGVNISTSQSKFGGSSLYVNGASGSRFVIARNPTLDLYGDFTVEGWFYPETLPASSFKRLWSFGTFGEANSFDVEFNVNPGPVFLRININGITSGGNASDSATGLISANNWYHVAVTRSSGTVKAWLDGTNVITINTSVTAAINKAQAVYIGSLHGFETNVNAIWNGYIDDFRVSQFARYTNTFTPPTIAFRKR